VRVHSAQRKTFEWRKIIMTGADNGREIISSFLPDLIEPWQRLEVTPLMENLVHVYPCLTVWRSMILILPPQNLVLLNI
jgi:hypothetical protein